MKAIGPDTGLNLLQDTKPPKSLYTEVNILKVTKIIVFYYFIKNSDSNYSYLNKSEVFHISFLNYYPLAHFKVFVIPP